MCNSANGWNGEHILNIIYINNYYFYTFGCNDRSKLDIKQNKRYNPFWNCFLVCCELTFATSNVCITHVARLTATDHSAQGQCVDDLADGIRSTWMGYIAWVLALAIETGQLAGTFRIHGAALGLDWQQFTAHCWIAAIAGWATALRTMIVHATLGANAAIAGILATLVATGQMEGAFIVVATLGSLATQQRIATIAVRAVTAGTMIEVRATDSSSATLSEGAGIHALLVDAGLGGCTLSVGPTAQQIAVLQCVSSVALVAYAERTMELHVAACLLGTQIGLLARIAADLIDAGLIVGALAIAGALRLRRIQLRHLTHALSIRGAIKLWRATANGLVIDNTTNCIEATRLLARITAFLADASAIARAVFVRHTLRIAASGSTVVHTADAVAATRRWLTHINVNIAWRFALHKWISNHVVGTGADRAVIDGLTDSAISAHSNAGIDALVIYTGSILGAIRAECAFRSTALAQWVTKEAGEAFTDSLISLHAAH